MGMEKVTFMVLKVDLQCHSCYKKVKKTICKFPQIRDQIYDEKGNTVTITVVCCSPEKIRDKLFYKGGKAIKSIEIKEPSKPKDPEKKKDSEKPKDPEKPKQPEKPKVVVIEKPKEPESSKVAVIEKPKEAEKPKSNGKGDKPKEAEKPKSNGKGDKPKDAEKPKEAEKPKDAEKPKEGPKNPEPVQNPYMMAESVPVQGFPQGYPVQPSFGPTYMAYGGVPSYHGYGVPPPPQPSYYGYYGYGHGHGAGSHVGRDDYFSDENPQGCSIM